MTALILLAHGSPDPDWRRPIDAVRTALASRMPERTIEVAFLESCQPSLDDVCSRLQQRGFVRAKVLCLFLSAGGNHLKRHVPERIAELGAKYPRLQLELVPGAVGAEPEVIEAISAAVQRLCSK